MTPATAARILRNYSAWRRNLNHQPGCPSDILEAIAVVCSLVERENRLAFRRLSGEHDRNGRRARLSRHRAKAKAGSWRRYSDDSSMIVDMCGYYHSYRMVELPRPRAGKVRVK